MRVCVCVHVHVVCDGENEGQSELSNALLNGLCFVEHFTRPLVNCLAANHQSSKQ